jgi:hypothetical protein
MEKYSVILIREDEEYFWGIYEFASEQVIDTFYFEEDAMDAADFMEKGGAFDGFTPSFMLQEDFLPKEEINLSFSRLFS